MTVMKYRLKCLLVLALAALAFGLAGCGGGGGGGGGGSNNGNNNNGGTPGTKPVITVLPLQFSPEAGQKVELKPEVKGLSNPKFSYEVQPPASILARQTDTTGGSGDTGTADQAELIARKFGSVDANGLFTTGDEAAPGLRGSVLVKETTSPENLKFPVEILIVPFIDHTTVDPAEISLLAGQSVTFRAVATAVDPGSGELVELPEVLPDWRVQQNEGGVTVGQIDQNGVFTGLTAGTGLVTAAVGGAAPGMARVTVVGSVTGLRIQPLGDPVDVEAGTSRQFSAVLSDSAGNQVDVKATWSVDPPALGTIDANGLFKAGGQEGVTGTVKATAQDQSATVNVRIVALLEPPGGPGNLSGQVRDAQGKGVAGATVVAFDTTDDSEVDRTTTDADGHYGLFLPVGTYRLEATSGDLSASLSGVVLPAQDVRLSVNLTVAPTTARKKVAGVVGRERVVMLECAGLPGAVG